MLGRITEKPSGSPLIHREGSLAELQVPELEPIWGVVAAPSRHSCHPRKQEGEKMKLSVRTHVSARPQVQTLKQFVDAAGREKWPRTGEKDEWAERGTLAQVESVIFSFCFYFLIFHLNFKFVCGSKFKSKFQFTPILNFKFPSEYNFYNIIIYYFPCYLFMG
jgi:hypothetical protein